jgi:hypothetical protein
MRGVDLAQGGPIGAERGGDQVVHRVGVGRRGTLCEEVVGDFGVAVELGQLDRGPAVTGAPRWPVAIERRAEVDAVIDQQPYPGGLVVLDRPAKLDAQHPRGRVQVLDPGPPHAAIAGAESVLEQQLQVPVIRLEHPVVKGLGIVGVGTRVEQQPAQRLPVGMTGLAPLAELAVAEHAGEQGERRR